MKAPIVIVAAALWMAVLIAGCGGGSDTPAGNDSITIDSISPSAVSAGTATFTIAVSYSLQTKDSGVINYAFQDVSSNSFSLETDERLVTRGSGTATFIATKTLTGNNVVRVLLSENPHPAPWSPLVSTQQTVTVN